mgnify:FL=1|jgi:hydrogenase maturation factor HypE
MRKLIFTILLLISIISYGQEQKIQLIIDYEKEDIFEEVLNSVDADSLRVFNFPYVKISEMNDSWLVICEPDDVTDLETALKLPPLRMNIIGTYNMDGTQYIWTEPKEIQRNHSINKYKSKLKDKITYDEDGNETNSRRPTESEALETQVNLIYGFPKRVLTSN